MSVTSTVVAVIAGDGRLDDAGVVGVHDLDIDRVARVGVRRRWLDGEGRRVMTRRRAIDLLCRKDTAERCVDRLSAERPPTQCGRDYGR